MYRRISLHARDKQRRVEHWRQSYATGALDGAPFGCRSVEALEQRLQGNVVLPGDPSYGTDRQAYHPRFSASPQIIIYCEIENDVRASLEFAQEFGLRVTCRSGGHISAGWSTSGAMILDTSRLNSLYVDVERKRLVAGAGTNFAKLGKVLDGHGMHIPTGG